MKGRRKKSFVNYIICNRKKEKLCNRKIKVFNSKLKLRTKRMKVLKQI